MIKTITFKINKSIKVPRQWVKKKYLIEDLEDYDKRVDKTLKYIKGLYKQINLSNQTKVAVRTIERLLIGEDNE